MKTKKQFPPSFLFFFSENSRSSEHWGAVGLYILCDPQNSTFNFSSFFCLLSLSVLQFMSPEKFVKYLTSAWGGCTKHETFATMTISRNGQATIAKIKLFSSGNLERGQWGGVVWYSVRNFECSNSQDPGPAVFIVRIKSIKFLRRSIKCMNN